MHSDTIHLTDLKCTDLDCITLHYTIHHLTTLKCNALNFTVLNCTELKFTAQLYAKLKCCAALQPRPTVQADRQCLHLLGLHKNFQTSGHQQFARKHMACTGHTLPRSCAIFSTLVKCTAIYCPQLPRTTHYRIVLHFTALYCIALNYTALYCTALHCIALYCNVLHCNALHCNALYVLLCIVPGHVLSCPVMTLYTYSPLEIKQTIIN